MSGSTPAPQPTESLPTRVGRALAPLRRRLIGYLVIAAAAGAVAGWLWHAIVALPTYLTSDDGSVQITERAQGQVFATDAVFVMIGLIVSVALGIVGWRFFYRLGWPVAPITVAGGLASGAACWAVGVLQGPRNFAERVATAVPGEMVPIDFELHTTSALLVWGLGAIIPVMLYANLSREEPGLAPRSRSGQPRDAGTQQPDEILSGDLN